MTKANNKSGTQALLIVGREFGDALLAAQTLQALSNSNPSLSWVVWCRPKTKAIFADLPKVDEVVTSQFPMGAKWELGGFALFKLAQIVLRLRFRHSFAFSLDLIGDIRELLLARMVGAPKHFHPSWSEKHAFRKLIYTPPRWLAQAGSAIDTTANSVYSAYQGIAAELSKRAQLRLPAHPDSTKRQANNNARKTVGLHPTATCESKRWPLTHWRQLTLLLQTAGIEVEVYGAKSERPQLLEDFGDLCTASNIRTGNLKAFERAVERLDLLVGLDSFSVHMAHYVGTPSIVLNSATDATLWTPPSSLALRTEKLCPVQPCLHKAPCAAKADAYICMTALSVETVFESCLRTLETKSN